MLLTHAHQSDLLVIISRGGSDDDLVRSAEVAMDLGMSMILFAHKSDTILMESLGYGDLCIDMSQFDESLLSTLQFQAVECLCSLIDQIILGGS
jgi:phosphoheptose isomerase